MMRPCLKCGEPTEGSYCEECKPDRRSQANKVSARQRGYDHRHDQLSKRARRLQPFCSDCGATSDLQLHHKPIAWLRKQAGKVIRLEDVEVLCGPCNRARGSARPGEEGPAPTRRAPTGRPQGRYTPKMDTSSGGGQ